MSEKLVVVHRSYIEEWSRRSEPPLPLHVIQATQSRIEELICSYSSKDVVIVEQLTSSGFPILGEMINTGDSVTLVGARAAYCLRFAREVLEGIGAKVKLDNKGSLS